METAESVREPAGIAPLPARGQTPGIWLAVYVAVLVGGFADWVPGLANLPLAKVAIFFAVLSAWRGRARLAAVRLRSQPITRVALAFLALALCSIGFSAYMSMSLSMIYLIVVLLISFVLLVKVTQTLRDVERLLIALCVASAGLCVAALVGYKGGRASVGAGIDPNDLAYGLVTTLPVIRALSVTARKKRGRVVLQGLAVAVVIAILLTGSRGGALAFGTVMLLMLAFPLGFARTGELKPFRMARFVAVLGVVVALGVGIWGYLPQESRERLATLVDLRDDYNAGTSKASRLAIWKRNSAAVWSRPIGFGIGTSEYVDGLTGGAYRALHNSFVEAFVELGVLGLVLFCGSYLVTLRQLGRVSALGRHSAPQGETARACLYARALRIALAGNVVAGFFLSDTYSALLWTLIAVCASLVRISLPPSPLTGTAVVRT